MAKKFKQDPPFLKKKEESQGKDLDGDNEKDPKHKAKVLGKKSGGFPFQKGKSGGKTKK